MPFRFQKFLYIAVGFCFVVFVVWPFLTGGRSPVIQTEFNSVNAQIEAHLAQSTPSDTTSHVAASTPDVLGSSTSPVTSSGQLDLNTATLKQLNDLPGIGESKAKAILDYRMKKGRFSRIEELTEVKGIGDKILEKLKPLLYVTSS
ncbi:helix-hairpin-helix domain-containing protein [Paenibacillus aceris]|uniref:Competence protein ComEA n=1 Tax=Paenibacillus aceris TaxID=869555 RepID=A0ABS4HSI0_9BACL|nr:competence protein ComEA [Paenibacillus aceris]NHW37707.1 helix-hairpin-helix domain-containing protein [Paenibacillus aceris]